MDLGIFKRNFTTFGPDGWVLFNEFNLTRDWWHDLLQVVSYDIRMSGLGGDLWFPSDSVLVMVIGVGAEGTGG